MVDATSDAAVEETETEDDPTLDTAAAAKVAQQLSDAIDALQPELAELEDDELDEEIVFVRNGWIRITTAGKLHKLRRPWLGELRDLDLSREADQEILNEKNQELRDKTEQLMVRAREIEVEANAEDIDPRAKAALDVEATQLALKAQVDSRNLIREAHSIRAAWWQQVFKILTPPGYEAPEQVPAWIGDLALQQRAIAHWQMVPLGRGVRKGK